MAIRATQYQDCGTMKQIYAVLYIENCGVPRQGAVDFTGCQGTVRRPVIAVRVLPQMAKMMNREVDMMV